jgi:hypothetical protein
MREPIPSLPGPASRWPSLPDEYATPKHRGVKGEEQGESMDSDMQGGPVDELLDLAVRHRSTQT